MTVHHLAIGKKYSDIKILVKDLIADYPDVTDGITRSVADEQVTMKWNTRAA